MTFPNAYDGVKKIYLAEIFSIVSAILGAVVGILGAMGDSGIPAAAIVLIVASVIMIAGDILTIVGVNRASKDEPAFKQALVALIVGIGANLLVSSFSENALLSSLGDFISKITEFLASFFICTGIINLADRLNDQAVSEKGKKYRKLLMGIFGTSAVLSLLTTIFSKNESILTGMAVVALISSIFSRVAYFMYLGLLNRAKKMLAK